MNLPATLQGLQNFAAADALAKAEKILPRVTTVLLAGFVAWQAARLTWLLMPHPNVTAPIVASVVATPSMSSKGVNAQKIAEAHLFGVATAEDDPDAIARAKVTNMTLVLAGTIASGDPEVGFAFIGESVQNAKFVKVGDTVGGIAKLHSVYADRVILDRGGQLESLLLPRQSLPGAPPPPSMAAAVQPTRFVENVKRIAETNPAAFSEIVRPQAFVSQGQMQGFRVYPGRNRQQFAKLGLQPGDLVKAINGTSLDDPQRSSEIFNTLSASDRAQITIERNGQIQQLSLNTSQITLPEPDDAPRQQGTPPQDLRLDPNGAPVQ